MAHLTRPAEISGVSAGSFPETAAGNRAYLRTLLFSQSGTVVNGQDVTQSLLCDTRKTAAKETMFFTKPHFDTVFILCTKTE